MSKKYIVDANTAPRAIGPFSQAVGFQGLLFLSGQRAIDPNTGDLVGGGVEAQTRQAMDNLTAVLAAAGLDRSHVLKATIYLRNMNDYALVDDVYGGYFDHAPPARTVVEVSRLRRDVLVEIEAIAAAPADYEALVEGPFPAESVEPTEASRSVEPDAISGDDALRDDDGPPGAVAAAPTSKPMPKPKPLSVPRPPASPEPDAGEVSDADEKAGEKPEEEGG